MTDDRARQEKPPNELESSDEAIEDLELDDEAEEAVKGGGQTLNIGSQSTGAGAGKVTF